MWIETKLEEYMHNKLSNEFNSREAEKYYNQYCTARTYLEEQVFSFIPMVESGLTDHSEKHIEDVLKKAWLILDKEIDSFNAVELYLLCICILFHDCGNIHGRDGHEKKIVDIYDEIVGSVSSRFQERKLVLSIVKAHSGESKKGDKDTLIEVVETNSLYDKEIKLRELSSILRFADELAEGPQRTSDYILKYNKAENTDGSNPIIKEDSIIYHKYASVTNVYIDKGNGRIALTYNIEVPVKQITFAKLLGFIYKRIVKLDSERRYCKYYAPSLNRFKRTEAKINICYKGEDIIDIPPIELGDKYAILSESVEDIILSRYPGIDENTLKTLIKEKGYNYDEESI